MDGKVEKAFVQSVAAAVDITGTDETKKVMLQKCSEYIDMKVDASMKRKRDADAPQTEDTTKKQKIAKSDPSGIQGYLFSSTCFFLSGIARKNCFPTALHCFYSTRKPRSAGDFFDL